MQVKENDENRSELDGNEGHSRMRRCEGNRGKCWTARETQEESWMAKKLDWKCRERLMQRSAERECLDGLKMLD